MDGTTKRQIIDQLKWQGGQTADQLSADMGLTSMAIRQHCYALAEEGLVETRETPNGVGRPAKVWHLTQAASRFFPNGYADLTADLLDSLRDALGEEGLKKVIDTRLNRQKQSYGAQIAGANDLPDRLETLAKIRNAEGYMAEIRRDGDTYVCIENHCPICAAAEACTGICAAELMLFRSVLGNDVTIERTEHILQGARRCAYRVTPNC
ncbi:MAG: metalloregulator ArsR/SmtB family transcription factor [Pseudomonadota bacterium]